MVLTLGHYIYILFIVIILITMVMKKESVVPCFLGVFFLGLYYKNSIAGALLGIFTSLMVALGELAPIILIISIMVALSKALEEYNAINLIISPISKRVKTADATFFVTGFLTLILSWFFWPSPAAPLVGAIFLPIAKKTKLPPMGLAVAVNIFGQGIALSTDLIIQGAPAITSSTAGIEIYEVISEGMILYFTMSVVTVIAAFIMLKRDLKNGLLKIEEPEEVVIKNVDFKTRISVYIVVISFILDIVLMCFLDLKGSNATALLGGTGVMLLFIVNLINDKKLVLDKVTEHISEGFNFGIKIFGIIIPISAFFYMGDSQLIEVFGEVLPKTSQGLLSDIGVFLSESVPINKVMAATVETVVGVITGLDGSGFSGMSLAGSLASVFGSAIDLNVGRLAALGQIGAIWTGGGCLVPWALVSSAAICDVSPIELAKRNVIPVTIGLAVTTIVAIFII